MQGIIKQTKNAITKKMSNFKNAVLKSKTEFAYQYVITQDKTHGVSFQFSTWVNICKTFKVGSDTS